MNDKPCKPSRSAIVLIVSGCLVIVSCLAFDAAAVDKAKSATEMELARKNAEIQREADEYTANWEAGKQEQRKREKAEMEELKARGYYGGTSPQNKAIGMDDWIKVDEKIKRGESVSPEEFRKANVAMDAWTAAGEPREGELPGLRIGMTADVVNRTSWGGPQTKNRTTTAHGTSEQWVYGGGNYLYFENGILTAIQTDGPD